MSHKSLQPQRWKDAVLESGSDLQNFWQRHLAERKRSILFILAKGFDPRMCIGIEMLLELAGSTQLDIDLIEFDEGPTSPSRDYIDLVDRNMTRIECLMQKRGAVRRYSLKMRSEDGRRITSQGAFQLYRQFKDIEGYSDIILDISAAPRGVYMPLAAKILYLVDQANSQGHCPPVNFHIMVAENSTLDANIQDEGVEERADYIPPFRGAMDREATSGEPRIWIPVLGENQRVQLERIHDLVLPDEICPVLPSPAQDPRRADNLIRDYHGLLFDNWVIEPKNFLYGCERNPFEVYRQIARAICSYRESFIPLGGSKFVLSALSSKLLSISALLVAYDFKAQNTDIGIAHVDCHGYRVVAGPIPKPELSGLWLTGEWEVGGVSHSEMSRSETSKPTDCCELDSTTG